MISNKYINAIIATFTAIALFFTTIIYVNSKNVNAEITSSNSNFTYVDTILNKEQVTEIDLEIDEDNWKYLLENASDEEYITANITVNGTKYYNVGIRAKGNSSLAMIAGDNTTDRYSFKVKFDEYIDGQSLDGLSKISLNNIMSDATYMKEYLSYDLLEKMGVPTPAFAFTNIKINGEEWGLYFAVEVIEEEFIERNYGSLSGNLYKPEGNGIGDMGNKENMEGFNFPDMENIEIPEGFSPPNMGNSENGDNVVPPNMNNFEVPEGFTPPNMGNGENREITAPPNMNNEQTDGNSAASTDSNIESSDAQSNDKTNGNGFRGGMMGFGGMGSSNGANLVYTDDNKESYSDIFNNNIFKTTTESDEDKVIEMIKNLNEGTNLEEYLNVDEILRYFAVNTFLVNLDSYASNMKHNYYLYEKDGVFEIIPWDYNLSFGGFTVGSASNAINFPIDSPVTDSLENSPLISKLLEVDEYKEIYHRYLQEIVDYVNDGTYEETINEVNSLIADYVKNDATAFYTYEEYEASLPELINFGIDRAKSISAQLDGSQPSTTYGTIETTVNLTALGTQGGMMNFQSPNNNSTDSSNIENNEIQEDQMPNDQIPEGQMPGGEMPNWQMPGGQMPDGEMPSWQMPDGEMPSWQMPDGEIPSWQMPDGQMPGGQMPGGQTEEIQTQVDQMETLNAVGGQTQMQNPNATNVQYEVQMLNNTTNNGNREINPNNRQQGFSQMNNPSSSTMENVKSTILTLSGYIALLLVSIVFVFLFKRRKFKA
ncbi:CotH kinase family protein [Clostridium sp. AL.422]|uniref:CotH kinase family protein n=1 Tax=Clostridium TaxID=1485 RepID=UPI00293DB715|nr:MULTISPECIES: CotH kinase family protein [unclassified Clostridium]MDV4150550.1 CotH kinase family protein [Clostridium sp. AL.422]